MPEWGNSLILAFIGLFAYLTARVTLATKKVDSSTEFGNKGFDLVMSRLEQAETELKELREVQINYQLLSDKYDLLRIENRKLQKRVAELEAREGIAKGGTQL